MTTLNIVKDLDSMETDVWEVDYFDTDARGNKLAEKHLGVRVNEGTWLPVKELLDFIKIRQGELDGTD